MISAMLSAMISAMTSASNRWIGAEASGREIAGFLLPDYTEVMTVGSWAGLMLRFRRTN